MSNDPYNWPFPQKTDTMTLSTINHINNDVPSERKFFRQSSFQMRDIKYNVPKKLIPEKSSKINYNLSAFIESKPQQYKKINKISNPLKIDDIEGTRSKTIKFTTTRTVDPLCPLYKLPNSGPIYLKQDKLALRNTLQTQDIVIKKPKYFIRQRGTQILNQFVQGSKPSAKTHQVNAIHRLQVNDIINQSLFKSKRQTNPITPLYSWRDQSKQKVNHTYGTIQGNNSVQKHPIVVNKINNRHLSTNDIDGAYHNSFFNRVYFLDKRRQFKNSMKTDDIDKAQSSSLKKGINTKRITNPLVPEYNYLNDNK